MSALIVLLTLCGSPIYVVGHSAEAAVAGPVDWVMSNPEPHAAMLTLINDSKVEKFIQELSEVTGGKCD